MFSLLKKGNLSIFLTKWNNFYLSITVTLHAVAGGLVLSVSTFAENSCVQVEPSPRKVESDHRQESPRVPAPGAGDQGPPGFSFAK